MRVYILRIRFLPKQEVKMFAICKTFFFPWNFSDNHDPEPLSLVSAASLPILIAHGEANMCHRVSPIGKWIATGVFYIVALHLDWQLPLAATLPTSRSRHMQVVGIAGETASKDFESLL